MKRFLVMFAMALLVVGCGLEFQRTATMDDPKDLRLVVSDITLDITTQHVFASDFVRIIHKSDQEAPYVFGAKLELIPMNEDSPWWNNEDHFDCEDLGLNEYWVRIQDDGNGWSEEPVRAYLTVVDSTGQCGEPMFNPGQDREEE